MKIQYISDLHLEGGIDLDVKNVGGDVLILAGDITTTRAVTSAEWFFQRCSERFKDVIYINGNHEFYRGDIDETPKIIRNVISKFSNIHYLENQIVEISGVNFFCATLWTDCNQGDPLTKIYLRDAMNDYHLIQWKVRQHWKLRPDDTEELHKETIKILQKDLEFFSEPFILVTHHGPSRQSIHPRYQNDYLMNGGYTSNLEGLMSDRILAWFHGHVHDTFDYQIGDTRVLTNPRGYMIPGVSGERHPENYLFNPEKLVEL